MSMFSRMYNQVNLLQKGLDTASMRQEVIAHNIANAETPDYDAKHVEFESMLAAAMSDQGGLQGRITRDKHFKIGVSEPLDVDPVTVSDTHYTRRMDGNNVDIDQEMVELSENTIVYNALVDQVNAEFNRLSIAIREGS